MNESADQGVRNGVCRSCSSKMYELKKVSELSDKLLTFIKNFIGSQWKGFKSDSVISQSFFVLVIILDLVLVIIPISKCKSLSKYFGIFACSHGYMY